jgi:SP family general alpha glucoside:H+ symporter-like MFS transporter
VNGHPVIPAYWQSLWNAMFNIMTMIGSFSSGQLQDLMGRRFGFGVASIVAIAGIAVNFIAATPGVFLAGKMVTGLAIGLILSGAQTYVSEITPLPMRGIALSTYTISLVSGIHLSLLCTACR